MSLLKENISGRHAKFLSNTYASKEEFISKYKRFYYRKAPAKELYLQILNELTQSILEGNVDNFKKFNNFISYINTVESGTSVKNYYDDLNNPMKYTNIVILACKYNKGNILEYILSKKSVIRNLSTSAGRNILLDDTDESSHNAFYYAIRSNNVALIAILIDKKDDLLSGYEELDKILSRAYEKLILRNVPLTYEMKIYIENILVEIRFYSRSSTQNIDISIKNIQNRIELVLENIKLLSLNADKINEKFIFIARFIAQNIHILKQQLNINSCRLPWEEIEFLLIAFIHSNVKKHELNIFFCAILDKKKLLKYLQQFSRILRTVRINTEHLNVSNVLDFGKLTREEIITKIITANPRFEELYNDYQKVRDIYTLHKLNNCIKLASLTDPRESSGQLVIIKTIQVSAGYLKCTLESPKLSSVISEHLLLSVSANLREIILDLRNSSHSDLLYKISQIEEKDDKIDLFTEFQNDIKILGKEVDYILDYCKIKAVVMLLRKAISVENFDDAETIIRAFDKIILSEAYEVDCPLIEIFNLVNDLHDAVTERIGFEEKLFVQVHDILDSEIRRTQYMVVNYYPGINAIQDLSSLSNLNKVDDNVIRIMKHHINIALKSIPPEMEQNNCENMLLLMVQMLNSIEKTNIQRNDLNGANKTIYKILSIMKLEINNFKWSEQIIKQLKKSSLFIPKRKLKITESAKEKRFNSRLESKLSELKNILEKFGLIETLSSNFCLYKLNAKLELIIKTLVLDIITILDTKNLLTNNLCYLDNHSPVLVGKYLYNHLIYDNALHDISLLDPSIALVLNARKLVTNNIIEYNRAIGMLITEDPWKVKIKYDEDLIIVTNQEKMFTALEEGNIQYVKSCTKVGADINGNSFNAWSALHFAAKGPSLEVVKLILNENISSRVENSNGQTALHVAAKYGRNDIVEFFITYEDMDISNEDNQSETPLHIATRNGFVDTVKVLLSHSANINAPNLVGFSPIHCAAECNNIDVFKILLEKEPNVDINRTWSECTILHIAAEYGCVEIVNLLLQKKADVNRKSKSGLKPLDKAVLNGFVEVVKILISNGADIHSKDINDYTTLQKAVRNGHKTIVNVLLEHGSEVNIVNVNDIDTPLHHAVKDGHAEITEALLKKKANPNALNDKGMTPFHIAAYNGYLEIVKIFLKYNTCLNTKTKKGRTPLFHAVKKGHIEIVKILLDYKIDVNSKFNDDNTLLRVAIKYGYKEIADLLIRNGANLASKTKNGSTLLHAAGIYNNADIIPVLLKYKLSINCKDNDKYTPLDVAIMHGNMDPVVCLLKNKAKVDIPKKKFQSLHLAVIKNLQEIVCILIQNHANTNAKSAQGDAPLDIAAQYNFREIIITLVTYKANINYFNDIRNTSPLGAAVRNNNKEIIEFFIKKGADVNINNFEPLRLAIFNGYKDIALILLQNNAHVNIKFDDDMTPLHLAADKGYKKIVSELIARGADINAVNISNMTPLLFAAKKGHEEIVKLLISAGANIHATDQMEMDTALHMAVRSPESNNVVKTLLNSGVDVNIKNKNGTIPIELAILSDNLQAFKTLLQHAQLDINMMIHDNCTFLHMAALDGNLKIATYLVEKGANVNAKDKNGAKPIHIAVSYGHLNIVQLFITKESSKIYETDESDQTLLHYAAQANQLEVMKYLVEKKIDINKADKFRLTPLHIAIGAEAKNCVVFLLENGAIFNIPDKFRRSPIEMCDDEVIRSYIVATGNMFAMIKDKNPEGIENCIFQNGIPNASDIIHGTALHFAAWTRTIESVDVLLRYKANPNIPDTEGFMPLHYAAENSSFNIVKSLLYNGAIYDPSSNDGKTPLNLSSDENIINLLKLTEASFTHVKNGNNDVILDLKATQDISIVGAVMNARNKENETLIVLAIRNNFPYITELKQILHEDVSSLIGMLGGLVIDGNYEEASNICNEVLAKRIEIFGPHNFATLDIQIEIARITSLRCDYEEALHKFKNIYRILVILLGVNHEYTLEAKYCIAMQLNMLGKQEEAYDIFMEVYKIQEQGAPFKKVEPAQIKMHMSLILKNQEKYEEALYICFKALTKFGRKSECDNLYTSCLISIANILCLQGRYDDAFNISQVIYNIRNANVGPQHRDTLEALSNLGLIYVNKNTKNKGLVKYREVYNISKDVLGPNHKYTLNIQFNIANVLLALGKYSEAFTNFIENLEGKRAILGPNHSEISKIIQKIESISSILEEENPSGLKMHHNQERNISIAANKGDVASIQNLLNTGNDINAKDINGRTPLHYATDGGHIDTVNMLLINGADIMNVTNEGSTPLHIAVINVYNKIVEVLLLHAKHNNLNNFVNIRTTFEGNAPLHIAAKNGLSEIVIILLKHGAIYNIKNYEGETPLQLSECVYINNLFLKVERLFEYAKNGNIALIDQLQSVRLNEAEAFTNTRNDEGNTLMQIVIIKKDKHLTVHLLDILKKLKELLL